MGGNTPVQRVRALSARAAAVASSPRRAASSARFAVTVDLKSTSSLGIAVVSKSASQRNQRLALSYY